ncbi:4-deoxy-4-formamido-L-arabinose-phosphoundecaprenol deformylase [Kaarinaea lacus]
MGSTANKLKLGLRVDVDTFSGTRDGVPRLLEVLQEAGIHASFFFTVGPDNMGRHLWRLLKPAFLYKMLRSNAASLYGWDILLRGTLWPGPMIGRRLANVIQDTQRAGHEVGLHAWDHHRWQARVDSMTRRQIREQIQLAMDELTRILGNPVHCSAAAGWKCTDDVLLEKNSYEFDYNSDCRGDSIFRPVSKGESGAPQIPVTLPTYDEVIGRNGISDANYNDYILSLIKPDRLNVLTIHAEVEGIARHELFRQFLKQVRQQQIELVPLSQLLPADQETIPLGSIEQRPIAGREGTVCWQGAGSVQ